MKSRTIKSVLSKKHKALVNSIDNQEIKAIFNRGYK